MTYAINNMMDYYINNMEQFENDYSICNGWTEINQGVVEIFGETLMQQSIIDDYDYSNSKQMNVYVSSECVKVFNEKVSKIYNDYIFDHKLVNILLLMSLKHLNPMIIYN